MIRNDTALFSEVRAYQDIYYYHYKVIRSYDH